MSQEIGNRIKEERKRMGFSIKTFAKISESSSDTLKKWEKGAEHPDVGVLSIWGKLGVDILYIITDRHLTETTPALVPRDKLFLSKYEAAPIDVRNAALLLLLNGESEPEKNKVKIGFY